GFHVYFVISLTGEQHNRLITIGLNGVLQKIKARFNTEPVVNKKQVVIVILHMSECFIIVEAPVQYKLTWMYAAHIVAYNKEIIFIVVYNQDPYGLICCYHLNSFSLVI